MSPRMGRTGGAAARGFGKGTAVRGPRGIPSVVSATAVGTVENASNGKLNLTWTNADATAQTRIYNGATLLATANAAATTYEVTTLNANTAYTLTVKHYKDSIESAGANFSEATTYQYNGLVNSTSCSNDYTYTLTTTYANGNNGTYTGDEQFSTSCGVTLRYTVPGTYYYTVPEGITDFMLAGCSGGGTGWNAEDYSTGNGGGGGAGSKGYKVSGTSGTYYLRAGANVEIIVGTAGGVTSFIDTDRGWIYTNWAAGSNGTSQNGGQGGDAADANRGLRNVYANGNTDPTTTVNSVHGGAAIGGGGGSNWSIGDSGRGAGAISGYGRGGAPVAQGGCFFLIENPPYDPYV